MPLLLLFLLLVSGCASPGHELQLVEAGWHEELLLRRGTYAQRVRAQIEKTGRLQ